MKVYDFKTEQILPISLEKAWDFFSSPKNLKEITPDYMDFKITNDLGDGKMYPGQIITYKVRPVAGIPMRWATEITHVKDHDYFVDEQRFGPYAMWHHQHFFEEVKEGVLMKDIINYAIPFGPIGRLANTLMVRSKLTEIFDYRYKKVEELFGKA
jgi:ligand-binding SRPBCC domain-containing protein